MVNKTSKASPKAGTKKSTTAAKKSAAGTSKTTAAKPKAAPKKKTTTAKPKAEPKKKTATAKPKAAPKAKATSAKPKATPKKKSAVKKTTARKKPAAEKKTAKAAAQMEVVEEEKTSEDNGAAVDMPETPEVVDVIDAPVDDVEDDGDDAKDPIDVAEATVLLPAKAKSADVVRLEPLQQYLSEIRRYPLLDREDERAIAIKYVEDGTAEAAHKLVTANLRLVVKIALDYRRYWMNLLDLIQEGNVGLMQAVKNFDPYKNVKLSSYASFWIKAYILKFIMDNWSLVKIGSTQAQRKLFFNLRKEQERLRKMGVDASAENIAKSLSVKENDVVEMTQRMAGSEFSLDAPVGADGEDTHMDFLTEDGPPMDDRMADFQVQNIFSKKLKEFRKTLAAKDAYLFDKRLVADDPLTLQEIGETYGVTRERIRQIESRLMRKLKEYMLREIPELQDFNIRPRGER